MQVGSSEEVVDAVFPSDDDGGGRCAFGQKASPPSSPAMEQPRPSRVSPARSSFCKLPLGRRIELQKSCSLPLCCEEDGLSSEASLDRSLPAPETPNDSPTPSSN